MNHSFSCLGLLHMLFPLPGHCSSILFSSSPFFSSSGQLLLITQGSAQPWPCPVVFPGSSRWGLHWLLQMGSSLSHHCFLTQNVSACWPQAFPFSTLDWKLILKGQDCGGFWLLCSQSLAHAWYIEKLNNCLLNKWIVGRGKDYITREEQKS